MGNYTSCFYVDPQIAKLIDLNGNLRQVKLPITAAEIMLEEPGHVVSPAEGIRQTRRIPVIKADDELSAGKVYMLVPASRAHCKVSESEMALVDSSGRKKKRANRRSSKVLPTVTEGSTSSRQTNDCPDQSVRVELGTGNGSLGNPLVNQRHWVPVLETISEGI